MQYLLTPLHDHFDTGFGATGNAFKDAADHLEHSEDAKKGNLFNANLPINFLYRHSIELFLKSAIVIFHRRLKLPYGEVPFDGEPMVLVGANWKPFNRVHSVATLWAYVRQLFSTNTEWLANNTKPKTWTFSEDLDADVQIIEQGDPRSTFFRYPTTNDLEADAPKSAMKQFTGAEVTKILNAGPSKKKVFAMIVENQEKEFVKGYIYDDKNGVALNSALRKLADTCYELHAAMRYEMCGGS